MDEEKEPYRSPPRSPFEASTSTDPMDSTVQEERTTLTGKPIPKHQHDNHTSMMFADTAGFGMGHVGANTLPPGYSDNSLVRIPIRNVDLGPEEEEPETQTYNSEIDSPEVQVSKKGRFGGLFKGLKDKTTSSRQKQREAGFQMVMMSRGDYLKYWAKGDDGKFLPNVVEPPEGRRQWVKDQLEKNEEWIRQDPELAKGGTDANIKTSVSRDTRLNTFADSMNWG